MHHVIGCGGTGSFLVPQLMRLVKPESIVLWDGDTVEHKNLLRQAYTEEQIGKNKAECMAAGKMNFVPEFYSSHRQEHERSDVLFCCADNHPARRECLEAVDRYGCTAIIGGNERRTAEAYIYQSDMQDGSNDPRVFYPAIATDHSNDPMLKDGCSVLVQKEPQLALANNQSAALMMHLYYMWFIDEEGRNPELSQYLPLHHTWSAWKIMTIRREDRYAAA